MADLLQLRKRRLSRQVDPFDDLTGHPVGHDALVAVGPQPSPMDVALSEGSGDVLPPHVLASVLPRDYHATTD